MLVVVAASSLCLTAGSIAAATITIINQDGAGEGFNDPAAAAPVGGNPGATVGAQRLYVFQYAANIWGGILPSGVGIRVQAKFDPLSCTATSGVLGSAGPVTVWRDFSGAILAGHWYHAALANKLTGFDLDGTGNDISATFNSDIGGATCLPVGWYYGVDGNEGGQIELLPVVLHELGHGLGFSTTTNGQTGAYLATFPGVFDHFLYDNTLALHWDQMNAGQRVTSGLNCQSLTWDGANVTGAAPSRLGAKPFMRVNTPGGIAGDYEIGPATFGPALTSAGITGNIVLVNDGTGTTTDGCEAIINSVAGKIALIDRGTCAFTVKVKNAQNAGALAVIIADNVAGCPPTGLAGTDATITIPSVRITQADGATLKANLGTGVDVTLRVDAAKRAGTDASGRLRMFSPNPYQAGSSISHWDTSAEPSLLMEPASTNELSSDVDLTRQNFADIGWFQGLLAVGDRPLGGTRLESSVPNPSRARSSVRYALDRDELVELAIFDLGGRLVSRLARGRMPAGEHTVEWDGTDQQGRPVAAGVYRYRLKTASTSQSRTIVLVR